MKDFLGECKNVFYMESDLANENEITGIVEDNLIEYNYDGVYGPIPDPETGMVDLSNYAEKYIKDYMNIKEIPQENLDYLNSGLVASNMANMFESVNCRSTEFPKLNIDTSKCTDMSYMFYLSDFQTIDISNFDTSSVTDMHNMFYLCKYTKKINMSNCDTSKVVYMYDMFESCSALTTFIGIIDMKSCINCRGMFTFVDNLSGKIKIKNPPSNFKKDSGINILDYEIVS